MQAEVHRRDMVTELDRPVILTASGRPVMEALSDCQCMQVLPGRCFMQVQQDHLVMELQPGRLVKEVQQDRQVLEVDRDCIHARRQIHMAIQRRKDSDSAPTGNGRQQARGIRSDTSRVYRPTVIRGIGDKEHES